MTKLTLEEIVEQAIDNPGIIGRLACRLWDNDAVAQQLEDKQQLEVLWRERPGHWDPSQTASRLPLVRSS